jgi:uncharacterized protein
MTTPVQQLVDALPLVDHHCHGVVRAELDRAGFEQLATESDWPAPPGSSGFDSQLGVVVRAECAPLLDLPRHASAEAYVERRRELGADEVNRRLLGATGIHTYLVDTGLGGPELLTPAELGAAAGGRTRTVVRLEAVAEAVAGAGVDAGRFAGAFAAALERAARDAVGVKTIVAYRYGLDFDPERPGPGETAAAAGEWLAAAERAGRARMDHPVLLRHLLWTAVDLGKPIQVHVGYGDSDVVLHRSDPSRMTGFIRATRPAGVPLLLLHCYPYHRQAGYLAQVYPHVWLDTGLAVGYTGLGSAKVIRESLELAPFHKVLFSTDACGLPELYLCGATLWRRGLGRLLDGWVGEDWLSAADAERYAHMIGHGNAASLYGLDDPG